MKLLGSLIIIHSKNFNSEYLFSGYDSSGISISNHRLSEYPVFADSITIDEFHLHVKNQVSHVYHR